jgi:hypothetical protein
LSIFCVLTLAGAGASAQVVYVDASAPAGGDGSSWGSAYTDLQQALTAARANVAVHEVRVAHGVYRPGAPGDRAASFQLVGGVSLRGGYAGLGSPTPDARNLRGEPTVLSGDLAGDDVAGGGRGSRTDNSFHVVSAVGLAYPAVIDGFHITGGNANGAGAGESQGGGVFVDQCGAGLTVSRCVVRDNDATTGGGVMVLDTEAQVSQCSVVGNRAMAWSGLRAEGMRLPRVPSVDHCTFAYNVSASAASAGVSSLAVGPNPDPGAPAGSLVALRMAVTASIGAFNRRVESSYLPQQFAGFLTVTSCLSSEAEGWVHEQNVTGSPDFADPLGPDGAAGTLDDDLRLRAGSPGIDAGGSAGLDVADVDDDGVTSEAVALDVDGSARTYGASTDAGSSEGPVVMAVTSPVALSINEGSSVPFVVRLSRDPGRTVRLNLSSTGVGGATPVATPGFVDLNSANWEAGLTVTVAWPADAGVTDDATDLLLEGPDVVSARQPLRQVDATTPPGVLYVNPSGTAPVDGVTWASGYRTLEQALAVAASQPAVNEVWVREGVYHPPSVVGESGPWQRGYAMRTGLRLRGGFAGTETSPSQRDLAAHRTVLNGDNLNNDAPAFTNVYDNCDAILTVTGAAPGTEVDGVEFERARTTGLLSTGMTVSDALTVRNCRFALNQFYGLRRGAAVGTSGVYGCVFEDNGGAFASNATAAYIACQSNGVAHQVEVVGCTFRRNYSADAALYVRGPRLLVSGCAFSDNLNGRAAKVEPEGPATLAPLATVQECEFVGNRGGLQATAGSNLVDLETVRVVGCTFHNNSGVSYGAGLAGVAKTVAVSCLFEGNSATTEGGAASVNGNFVDCVFRGNHAARGGAGTSGGEGCLFESNYATEGGGAAYETSGTYRRCVFRNNTAPRGGAFYHAARLEDCVFEGNTATAGNGGAVESGYIALYSSFSGNSATGDGGAGTVQHVFGCRFAGNTAGGNGGGLNGVTEVSSSLFTGNTAGGSGGAAFGVQRLAGCTVYGNHATATGGVDIGNVPWQTRMIANSILWGNTASTGTLEAKQVRAVSADPVVEEILSGRQTAIGSVWAVFSEALEPTSGAFTPAAVSAKLSAPFGPPYTYPRVSSTPAGGLAAMTPARTPAEQWVGVLPSSATVMPSALMQARYSVAPVMFSSAVWDFSFAVVGSLGDASSPGLYANQTGLTGSVGGSPDVQTDFSYEIGDFVQPAAVPAQTLYVRSDYTGFAGIRFRSKLTYSTPGISWCIVEGLSDYAGNSNTSGDPLLTLIAGADGVLGTADDDATPLMASPAVDSGNSRMILVDGQDVDGDNDRLERVTGDLLGNARVSDCPVDHGAVGPWAGMDRGAVEVLPFQLLMAPPCLADIGMPGGVRGRDGHLDNNDFVVFIDAFFAQSAVADVGSVGGTQGGDGRLDNNDFVIFIELFFAGC